jgi:hypothetical protein
MKLPPFLADLKTIAGTIVGLAAAVAVLFAVYSHFHTDAEAAEHVEKFESYQAQQYAADKFDRVDRVEREIDRIDYDLLSDELTLKQIDYLKFKREDLKDKIKCIQEDNC